MLKLTQLELSGFKSFYQKTRIQFPGGITAVVGPNGCGKSNISDAISWVLGVQSSKALRGSKMEDLIFNGSEKRGPLPMAEVTLKLAWAGPDAPVGPDGIALEDLTDLDDVAAAADGNGHAGNGHSGNGHTGNGDGRARVEAALQGEAAEVPATPSDGDGDAIPATGVEAPGEDGDAAPATGLEAPGEDGDAIPAAEASGEGGDAVPATGTEAPGEGGDAVPATGAEASDGAPAPAAGDDTVGATDVEASKAPPRPVFHIPTEEGAEVSVTRRLFRSGDSEYRINDQRCRLRDVQDFMRAARIGSRTYAVIEQDRISSLLSARPKERKELIEEAAGILGFKARRRAAMLKLDSAEANLSRLRDLLSEIQRQLNSLKRQAAKAKRFRKNAEEIRRQRRILFHQEHQELARRTGELEEKITRLQEAEAAAGAEHSSHEARLQALREEVEEEGRGAGERRDALHAAQRAVDRLEATMTALAERAQEGEALAERRRSEAEDLRRQAAEARQERGEREEAARTAGSALEGLLAELHRIEESYTAELAQADVLARQAEEDRSRLLTTVSRLGEAKNISLQLEERARRLQDRRRRLEKEKEACLESLQSRRSGMEESARGHQQQTEALAECARGCTRTENERDAVALQLEEARAALAKARHEIESLEERENTLAALWNDAGGSPSVADAGQALGEGVEVSSDWESAAGAWLRDVLPARVVPDLSTALAAAEQARSEGRRIRLVISDLLDATSPARAGRTLSAELVGDERMVRALSRAAGEPQLVDDLAAAVRAWRECPDRPYLTPRGEGITASGVLRAGGPQDGSGLLALNRQRRQAANRAAACRAALPGLEEAAERMRRRHEDAVLAAEQAREHKEKAAQNLLEQRVTRERDEDELQRLELQLRGLEGEESLLAEEEVQHRTDSEAAAVDVSAAEQARVSTEAASQRAQGALDRIREGIHALSGDRAEHKSECAARKEALAALQQDVVRLTEQATSLETRAGECEQESSELVQRAQEQRREREALEAERKSSVHEAAVLQEKVRADEMTLQEIRSAVIDAESEAKKTRQALEGCKEARQAAEVERARVDSDRDHLARESEAEFQCGPEALVAELGEEEKQADPESVRQVLQRLEEIRDRLGAVNMMALDQLVEVEERETYLSEQQADLEDSVSSLKATIERINETSRARFEHALEAIRGEFASIFRTLFGGGVADIVLQEPENVLESGLDIIAQPPGKRTRNINLLSGGEKSLSAIALLFAIFRYRPSPFCLLDEVDAALDEANVERFARLVRNYGADTQFILITHNRRSMAIADVMYGVTMEEPGISQTVSLDLA